MSSAAREEAIALIAVLLGDADAAGLVLDDRQAAAERIFDRLDETFAISRRAPRVHRPSDDSHPRNAIERAMDGGRVMGVDLSAVYPTGTPRSGVQR